MNCKEIENNIWDYVEGSLDTSQSEQIAKHIQSCVSCASLEKGVKSSLQLIEQTRKTEADPFFFTRLEARMVNEKQTVISRMPHALRYAVAASIAFVAIVGGSLFGNFSAKQLNSNFANQLDVEQVDDFTYDLADNSFDLIKDFE